MAFLAKKVPKIFPSKTKKGHGDLLSSNHCKLSNNKGKNASLFRKISRDSNKEEDQAPQTPTPNHHHHHHQPLPKRQSPVAENTSKTKHRAEALDYGVDYGNHHHHHHNNNNYSSDGHSSASTLESSPTPTPRETMDPTMLVLPDLPKLAFPSQNGMSANERILHNNHSNNIDNTTTNIPSSLRLVPRPALQQAHEEYNDRPPVALVAVPMEFAFPPPPPLPQCGSTSYSSSSPNKMVVASCLTRPPPRAGEWDDATIESHGMMMEELEDPPAETDHQETHIQDQQQQQQTQQQLRQRKATAQASAIMKPWIERAARLALLQNRVCGNLSEQHSSSTAATTAARPSPLVLQRQSKAALLKLRPRPEGGRNSHHRALLASLEKGRDTTTAAPSSANASTTSTFEQEKEHPVQPAPRIVKWHVVRQPCK